VGIFNEAVIYRRALRDPSRAIQIEGLLAGQRVLHRLFGLGTVIDVAPAAPDRMIRLTVRFDDEGEKMLMLRPSA